jgi:hypothetical protein
MENYLKREAFRWAVLGERAILLGLVLLVNTQCSGPVSPVEELPNKEAELLVQVEPSVVEIWLWDELAGAYAADRLSILFTNHSDSTLYLPLCGGIPPTPIYQRQVSGEWQDAILMVQTTVGCDAALAIEPGDTYSDSTRLVFYLEPSSLPLDGEAPKLEDVYGQYRMLFQVYSASWFAAPIPVEALLPIESRISNPIELVPKG